MNDKKVINDMLFAVSGARLGDRDVLPAKKTDFLSEEIKARLLDQWQSAGRDAARVFAKLDEQDGTSFYVTGWDGKGAFAGFETGNGFGYLPSSRLVKAKLDEKWDTEATLGFVRQNLCEMEQSEISDLLDKLKRAVTKRSKGRRKNEIKNFIKKFEKMMDAPEPVVESDDKAKRSARRANFFKHRGSNTAMALHGKWHIKPDVNILARPAPTKGEIARDIQKGLDDRKEDKKIAEGEQNEVAAEMRKFAKPDWKRSPLRKGK